MDADLAEKLNQRIRRIESIESSSETSSINGYELDSLSSIYEYQRSIVFHPCIEYSRKQIQNLMEIFHKYDTDKDKSLNFIQLKCMMEKLGIPQTHLSLKEMIKQVDEDHDGRINFHEFLIIFRKIMFKNNELENKNSSVLYELYAMLLEIDVSKEGVGGAKHFFEAKVAAIKEGEKFQRDLREEQEQRRRMEEDKIRRKLAFQNRLARFQITEL